MEIWLLYFALIGNDVGKHRVILFGEYQTEGLCRAAASQNLSLARQRFGSKRVRWTCERSKGAG
jgi:hypothetical protein